METKELKKILDNHKLWIDSDGKKGTCVNLSGANLEGADLRDAVLIDANLIDANLEGANLKGADLTCANLQDADLTCANLEDADLEGANLKGANLKGANLRCAFLTDANLEGVNLKDANLRCAFLTDANLKNTTLPSSLDNLPEGELIGYKKLQNRIVKLQILADSKRSRATSDKCRCDKALVLSIENIDGTDSGLKRIVNNRFYPTAYKVGEIVRADSWDENRWNECSHGIHFFLQRLKAVGW